MKKIEDLEKTVAAGLELLKTFPDVKEAEVFAAVNSRFVGRCNFASGLPCNGVQELKSDDYFGTSVRAVFKTENGLKIGFGSQDQEISLDAVKKAFAKAREAAISDANFRSLAKPIGLKPVLENYHDPKVMRGDNRVFSRQPWRVLRGALETFGQAGFGVKDALNITGDVTILREQMAVANTNGILDCDQSTILMASVTAMIEGKDSKGTGWASGTHFDSFDAEAAGRMAAQSAIRTVGGQRIKSGRYNVVFGHQPVCEIFSNLIIPCLALDAVVLKISPFEEKLDQQILAEDLSVYDDGSLPGRMASKRITCEGIPTGRTPLVERGRLVGLLANTYYAYLVNDPRFLPRNGFRFSGGGRLHRLAPRISATNLVVESSNPLPARELLEKVKDGVLIGRLWYLYPIHGWGSGDFTGTVVGDSYLIKDGKIVNPLKPNAVRINDNWLRLLKENILGVSQEQKPTLIWAAEEEVLAPQIACSDVELEEIDVFMEETT